MLKTVSFDFSNFIVMDESSNDLKISEEVETMVEEL